MTPARRFAAMGAAAAVAALLAAAFRIGRPARSSKGRTVARLQALARLLPVQRATSSMPFELSRLRHDDGLTPGERSLADELARAHVVLAVQGAAKALPALTRIDERAAIVPRSPGSEALARSAREELALAYLRLGEEQNCRALEHAGMCTLPLQPHAWHRLKEGSTKAAALYESLLERNPGDLVSRWLLNVSLMTLGRSPDGEARRWLVPPGVFRGTPFPFFEDRALKAGLGLPEHSGGSVIEDFDGDGLLDLVTTSSGLDPMDQMRFYHNEGDGTFTDRTARSGLMGLVGGLHVVATDYDNDGRPDLLVSRGAWVADYAPQPPSLLRNKGDGTFEDVTDEAGLSRDGHSQVGVWADYDGDGRLDLFEGEETTPGSPRPVPCRLYHNDGPDARGVVRFTEVGRAAGVDLVGFVKGAAWGDYDGDGRPDLFVSLQHDRPRLYHNDGPDARGVVRFTEAGRAAGLPSRMDAFSAWWWDYDNDGRLDLFVSEFDDEDMLQDLRRTVAGFLGIRVSAPGARLFHNEGGGRFKDVTRQAGLDGIFGVMGAGFGDLDNDGYPDMLLGTGSPHFGAIMPNRAFHNVGGRRFEEVTYQGGFGHLQKGHSVVFADVDGDGAVDVYASMGGMLKADAYRGVLYHNPGGRNHWVEIGLQGRRSNRPGLGAVIKADILDAGRKRSVYSDGTLPSFGNAPIFKRHLGLGSAQVISRLEVYWPASGLRQVFRGVAADRAYMVVEGEGSLRPGVAPGRLQSGPQSSGGKPLPERTRR